MNKPKLQQVGIYSSNLSLLEKAAELIGDYYPIITYHGESFLEAMANDLANQDTLGFLMPDEPMSNKKDWLKNEIEYILEKTNRKKMYVGINAWSDGFTTANRLLTEMGQLIGYNVDMVDDKNLFDRMLSEMPSIIRKDLKHEINVTVVDDKYHEVAEMIKILQNWPGINVLGLNTEEEIFGADYSSTNILLLDGSLHSDDLTGGMIAQELISKQFPGVICSISERLHGAPIWTRSAGDWHFPAKRILDRSPAAFRLFIGMINAILDSRGWST